MTGFLTLQCCRQRTLCSWHATSWNIYNESANFIETYDAAFDKPYLAKTVPVIDITYAVTYARLRYTLGY